MTAEKKKLLALLLLTDNPLTKTFFGEVIKKLESHTLIVCSSKEEAMKFLELTPIHLIVIDEKTPHLELTPFCTDIRMHQEHTHTPILLITAHLKKSFIRTLMKAGVTDFLREPLDEDECLLRIDMAQETMQTQLKVTSLSSRLSSSPKTKEDS